jgi:hypothetical protein
MSPIAVILFARRLVRKLRREANLRSAEKWRTRTNRLLQTFICACGGETIPGIVRLFGKLVRTDYLKTSLRLLCRDRPSKHAFFYKALPVNVEKWVEALCLYDIDTYTPRAWSMKHAEPRDMTECATVAELSIFNETPEFVDFFTVFKQRLKHLGVRAREFNTREDYEASMRVLRAQGCKNTFGCAVHAGDRLNIKLGEEDTPTSSPGMGVGRPLWPVKPVRALRPLTLRPSDDNLAVENVLGIIVRGGVLVAVGSGGKLLALYATDKDGTLVKSFGDDTFVWKQIVDRICGVVHNMWVMTAVKCEGIEIAQDVRTSGMDVPLTLEPGVGIADLVSVRSTSERRFAAICAHAAQTTAAHLREATHRRVATPLRAQGSDLVRQITLDLKERGTPTGGSQGTKHSRDWADALDALESPEISQAPQASQVSQAPMPERLLSGKSGISVAFLDVGTSVSPVMPLEKVVPAYNVPKLCRNAWVDADGSCVEVVNSLQRDVILGRARTYGAKRCTGCPPEHPDPLRTERMVCSAPQCSSKFLFYTTTTHYVYKKASGRSLEEDINLPLFSDQVLRKLSLV